MPGRHYGPRSAGALVKNKRLGMPELTACVRCRGDDTVSQRTGLCRWCEWRLARRAVQAARVNCAGENPPGIKVCRSWWEE